MPSWSLIKAEDNFFVTIEGVKMRKPNGECYSHITACSRGIGVGQIKLMFLNSNMGRNLAVEDFLTGEDSSDLISTDSVVGFLKKLTALGISQKKRPLLGERDKEVTSKRVRLNIDGAEKVKDDTKKIELKRPSFTIKSRGIYSVRANFLLTPPAEVQVRRQRSTWVAKIKEGIRHTAYKIPTNLPVLVDNESMGPEGFKPEQIANYRLFVLGGNHVVQAVKELMEEHPTDTSFGIFSVELYEGLTKEEAMGVANQHNARCETLKITFQDKVRQARQLKEEGEEQLSTKVAAMLSDILLKDVGRSCCTTLVSVAKYNAENYGVVEEIFEAYEMTYWIGKTVPEKLLRILQSPLFNEADLRYYLLYAKDNGLRMAVDMAEKAKKMKTVKNTFRQSVGVASLEEARECYPSHTDEKTMELFANYPANQEFVS